MNHVDYKAKLVKNIISKISAENPDLGTLIAKGWRNQSAQMGGILDDLGNVLSNGIGAYADIQLDKERAKIEARRAKEIAEQEARLMEQQIQYELAQAQTEAQRNQLMTQQFEMQQFLSDMTAEKWQRSLLWIGGGLFAFLIFNRLSA